MEALHQCANIAQKLKYNIRLLFALGFVSI